MLASAYNKSSGAHFLNVNALTYFFISQYLQSSKLGRPNQRRHKSVRLVVSRKSN